MTLRALSLAVLALGCQSRSAEPAPSAGDPSAVEVPPPPPASAPAPTPAPQRKAQRAEDLVEPLRRALREQKVELLAELAHPRGVRFSPYAHIDTKRDVVLTPGEIRSAASSDARRRWGRFDGTGKPIELDFREYFKRFVVIPAVAGAKTSVDKTQKTGNTLDNLKQVYPDATFIELHHPGADPKLDGMDWQSVRFVFSRHDGQLRLIAVVHDQWTI
jgi:hypothetical protein